MAGTARHLIVVLLLGAATGAGAVASVDPIAAMAGRYVHRFRNATADGAGYWSDDVAEIVPVDGTHANVHFELSFANGHSCSLDGLAQREGETLVYRAPPEPGTQTPCRLVIRRRGDMLTWDDEGTCAAGHCGMRGSFRNGSLPWAGRRPVSRTIRLH